MTSSTRLPLTSNPLRFSATGRVRYDVAELADQAQLAWGNDGNDGNEVSRPWRFRQAGSTQNAWFIKENPMNMDDLGIPSGKLR